jgi:hypothetical protein
MPDALHGDLARLPLPALLTADPGRVVGLVGGLGSGLTRLGLPGSTESVWVGTVFTVIVGLVLDVAWTIIQRFTTSRGLRI